MGAFATGALQSTQRPRSRQLPTRLLRTRRRGSAVATPLSASAPIGEIILYSISGTDAASFTINPQTGEISLAEGQSPDYEEPDAHYSLNVTATTQVTIGVTNVDEPGTGHNRQTRTPVRATR